METNLTIEGLVDQIRADFPDLLPSDSSYSAFRDPDYRIDERLECRDAGELLHFPVELLLEEASHLLDRCLATRNSKLDLEVRAIDFWINIQLARFRERIKREQIAAGEFDLPASKARYEEKLHKLNLEVAAEARARADGAAQIRASGDVYSERIKLAGKVARLTAYNRTDAVEKNASELQRSGLAFEHSTALFTQASSRASENQHRVLGREASKRRSFEEANVELKTQLLEAEVEATETRAFLARQTDIGLNFGQRLRELVSLHAADFGDAHHRLCAAARGLREIYGLETELPELRQQGSTTDLVLWVRARIGELGRLLDRETATNVALSLDQLMGPQGWEQALKSGHAVLYVPRGLFPEMNSVRLRSLHVSSRGALDLGRWMVSIVLPRESLIIRPSGEEVAVSQTAIPALRFWDVGPRDAAYVHGRSSGRPLHNASPIGKWQIEIADRSSTGHPRESLQGLDLLLEVVALSAKRG